MPSALGCVNCNYCIELYEKKSGVLANNMIMTCRRMCFLWLLYLTKLCCNKYNYYRSPKL